MSRRTKTRRRAGGGTPVRPTEWTRFEVVESFDPNAPEPRGNAVAFQNSIYLVQVTECDNGWEWLSIKRHDKAAVHDWRDFQRIKDELCGREREALELYPAESRVVDTSNQYHLWVMPRGAKFPLGWSSRCVVDGVDLDRPGEHRQRPLPKWMRALGAMSAEDGRAALAEARVQGLTGGDPVGVAIKGPKLVEGEPEAVVEAAAAEPVDEGTRGEL